MTEKKTEHGAFLPTFSLKQKSRSGESVLSLKQWCCHVLSLRRDLLAWARWPLAQDWSSSPKRQLAQHL